jgi:hypothetical protein
LRKDSALSSHRRREEIFSDDIPALEIRNAIKSVSLNGTTWTGVASRSLRFVSRYGLQFLPAYASASAFSR